MEKPQPKFKAGDKIFFNEVPSNTFEVLKVLNDGKYKLRKLSGDESICKIGEVFTSNGMVDERNSLLTKLNKVLE